MCSHYLTCHIVLFHFDSCWTGWLPNVIISLGQTDLLEKKNQTYLSTIYTHYNVHYKVTGCCISTFCPPQGPRSPSRLRRKYTCSAKKLYLTVCNYDSSPLWAYLVNSTNSIFKCHAFMWFDSIQNKNQSHNLQRWQDSEHIEEAYKHVLLCLADSFALGKLICLCP